LTQFRLLGPLEVSDGDTPLQLGGAGQRALLALLLLHANEVVSSDRLIDELWGEEPPGSGASALQVRVSQLRKGLGAAADRIETKPPGYVLRVEPGELDLDRFTQLLDDADRAEPAVAAETLREALALWHGPALADLAYESFAQRAIGRLEELRLTATERRIEADLALGRHAQVVSELESLVAGHPLRERLRGQLILSLYRSDRQAEALEAYRATRQALVEELGIEPGPALQELERRILQHDPELRLTQLSMPERAILVAPRESDRLDLLLSLAEPLARRPPKELILTRAVSDAGDLAATTAALQERRATLQAAGIAARAAAFVSATPADDIVRMALEQEVDLVLLDGSADPLREPMLTSVLTSAPCDIGIVFGAAVRSGPVLVPFVGAEHDWAAIELGAWAAGALGVSLLVAGPSQGPGGRDASRLLASASLAVQRTLGVAAEPLLLEPGPVALVHAAGEMALVVVGLTDRWQREGLGPVREALVASSAAPVVLVRRGLRPGGLAPREGLTRFTWTLRG
jgi:DNA-binding SARP family transcriptional activator